MEFFRESMLGLKSNAHGGQRMKVADELGEHCRVHGRMEMLLRGRNPETTRRRHPGLLVLTQMGIFSI